MRARQRHINPKEAGSTCAYDTRFLSLANNTKVATWPDRGGVSNATQGTDARRPTFYTNIQGGNPSIRFFGAGQTWLGVPSFAAGVDHTSLCVAKFEYTARAFNYAPILGGNANNIAPLAYYGTTTTALAGSYSISTGGSDTPVFDPTSAPWRVFTTARNNTGLSGYMSNVGTKAGNLPANNAATIVTIGSRSTLFYDNYLSSLIVWIPRISQSLTNRYIQSMAYSFKIPT